MKSLILPEDIIHLVSYLTPVTLAALSVDLESAKRNTVEDEFLDYVNKALTFNVGEDDAEEFREWYRNNII